MTDRAIPLLTDYGNERECGEGVARAIKDGLVKRSDLFIVSKLWNSFHDAERVEPVCRHQLSDWGVDYFDLYYIHFPVAIEYVDPSVRYPPGWHADDAGKEIRYSKATLESTWHAMEALVDAGLARSIAVSNYNGALMLDLLRYARVKPVVLQIEHHPYLTQERLLTLCRENGIAVTAYSSFGPQSFVDLDMEFAKGIAPLLQHEAVKKVADAHGKSPAQVLLRWATQRGLAVIPKSQSPGRLEQNMDVTGWDLAEEEIKEISGLDKGLRFNDPVNVSAPPSIHDLSSSVPIRPLIGMRVSFANVPIFLPPAVRPTHLHVRLDIGRGKVRGDAEVKRKDSDDRSWPKGRGAPNRPAGRGACVLALLRDGVDEQG